MKLAQQRTLNSRAWSSLAVLSAVMGVLLFATAGTVRSVSI
jgi:hypothetical protein